MRILKLVLIGYKRLALSGISKVEYTPESNIQIILGRNMSGKSQLLRQLNPLPANITQEFEEDGSKYIKIDHLGRIYDLSSSREGHSFKVDNVEYNKSGKKKEQLQLVYDHFKLSNKVVDIMLGNIKFVNMSPIERQNELENMSRVDFEYSVGVYRRIKQRLKDTVGGIKLLRDRISTNKQKLKTDGQPDLLGYDLNALYNFKRYVLDHKANIDNPDFEEMSPIAIDNLLTDIIKPTKIDTLFKTLQEQEIEVGKLETSVAHIVKKIADLEKLTRTPSLEELKDKQKKLVKETEVIQSYNVHGFNPDKTEDTAIAWDKEYANLIELITNLIEHDNVRLGDRDAINTKYEAVIKQEQTLRSKLQLILDQLEQLKDTATNKVVKCDKCGNAWIDNNQEQIARLNEYKERINSNLVTLKPDYDTARIAKKRLDYVIECERSYLSICDRLSRETVVLLNSIFDIRSSTIQEMLNGINEINLYINKIRLLSRNRQKIREQTILIQQHEELSKLQINDIQTTQDLLAQQLKEESDKKYEIIGKIKYNREQLRLLEALREKRDYIHRYLVNNGKKYKYLLTQERNAYLLEIVNLIDTEIVYRENIIKERDMIVHTINEDTKQLQELEKNEKILTGLAESLSPESGLIAKSLAGSINAIIEEMNYVINKIWTYPVELLPWTVEGDRLNYYFKVRVNDGEVIEDISKLSSSLQEIVNLAFRLVYYNYKRFTNYPLYLDEFGNTFDKEHRTQAYRVIEKLLASEFSQMFIITHYNELYGSIHNADFNVLDENNIDLSGIPSYNQHVHITRS